MATLLVGYDVEAFAIGEGLARLGDHGFSHALEPDSTEAAMEVILSNHERFDVPATLFVCGRTLVHNVGLFKDLVNHPLMDIQQHTYSHTLFKPDYWKDGVFLSSPPEAVEMEVSMTSAALKQYLDVDCIGLRTPHGYHLGLTDCPEKLNVLERCGIRYVSSWGRNEHGENPTPFSVQPFWYSEQGHPEILEIPFQGWLDGVWFEEKGIHLGREYAEVLCDSIDEIVEGDLVYGACFHDWTMLRYDEAGTRWVHSLLSYAREQDVEIVSYSDYYYSQALVGA